MIARTSRALVLLLSVSLALVGTPAVAAQGEIVRASVSSSGVPGNGSTDSAVISGDGRYVVFVSKATNLVAGDTNSRSDIFRFDRLTGSVVAVSVSASSAFLEATHGVPAVSDDGRYVAFWSDGAFDTGDSERSADVVLKDMLTGAVERLSIGHDGSIKEDADRINARTSVEISADGRWVAFSSAASNLVVGDVADGQPDLYLRDRGNGTTLLLSTEPGGGPGPSSGTDVVISGAGAAAAAGFAVQQPENAGARLVIRMLEGGTETQVEGVEFNNASILVVAAGGGTAIVSGQSGSPPSEYNVSTKGLTGLPANVDWSQLGAQAFSSDLRFYVVAAQNQFGFVVYDREAEAGEELPRSATGALPDQDVVSLSISDDGSIVAFATAASNLIPNDTNGVSDAFSLRIGTGIFADDDGNPFEADIEWLFEGGITLGCGFDLFCPKAPVTREQMASFLVRALDLPVATGDAFDDDETSLHQADINALAAAGITTGCDARKFCPNAPVTREQMASFLVRALDLPGAAGDYFTDDNGSPHEPDNNALALAQVTLGCEPGLFCPTATVLREQMAAFLHRALG